MKKILVMLFAFSLLGATQVVAATNTETVKVSNTRIVKADKDTNLTYGKVKFFVPAGQALVLGQVDNGSVLVRAARLEGVKIGKATIDSKLPVALYVDPATNAIIVDQGKDVQLVDNNGRTAVMSQGAAVSGEDIGIFVGKLLSYDGRTGSFIDDVFCQSSGIADAVGQDHGGTVFLSADDPDDMEPDGFVVEVFHVVGVGRHIFVDVVFDVVAVLSGLEPQRTALEKEIIARYQNTKEQVLIVQGLMHRPSTRIKRANLTIVPTMGDAELMAAMKGAKHIIARSGYSTIMDLETLGVMEKAELIPTPGQTEQEYLAFWLQNRTSK